MKIIILGSHGTGKTTLSRQLYNCLRQKHEAKKGEKRKLGEVKWTFLPEAPKQASLVGFGIEKKNKKTSLESEWWIIAKQLEMELLTPEPWLADKCLIDLLAYAYYLFPEEKDFLKVIHKIVKHNVGYDLVFYLPSGEFPIEDDGWRSLDPVFQKKIDEMILKIMSDMKIDYFILTGEPGERLGKAKEIIKKMIG